MIGTPRTDSSAAPVMGAGTPVPGGLTPVPADHGSAAPVTSSPSQPPSLVGMVLSNRYRLIRKLGEGGMGSVYLAEHTTINKKLAIKILSDEYAKKQDLVDRFLQEARAASMIEQENVVEITDFGETPGGSVFFVMEFLNGEDLSKTIKKTAPLPWHRVKPIMLQICAALTAAHDVGIIHR
ncbi:MAG: serine/threonine protein kinase, partial [Myxococcales bacterium]|nr:serine/threonine protein kinase [Myxococcales bacterium]